MALLTVLLTNIVC